MEHRLGFDRIREMLLDNATNELARRMIQELAFMTDYDAVCNELDLTEEMRHILLMADGFPMQDYLDVSELLVRLRTPGSTVTCEELFALKISLQTIASLLNFLLPDDRKATADGNTDNKPAYPHLSALAAPIEYNPALSRELDKLIDDRGELYDNASETLLDIRRQMARKRSEVDVQVARALAHAKHEGWAPANAEATIRNGRPVIPMLDTHRRKMRGIIHDESASRQTAFVEPSDVVELGNDLRQLQFDEHHEIQRILLQTADRLRPQLPQLMEAYTFLAKMDFLRAKAQVAIQLHAVRPIVDRDTRINWIDARHPLLHLGTAAQRDVVPFNLSLDTHQRILIVSGPNAGGKSVLLKAVGLLQYMLQCGLLVPCRETSEWGIFDNIFIDIGDQQSIDDDLSTYTSHLRNMNHLLEVATPRTLFLLDELGGGTEPRAGCAIATALLEELCERGSLGVVTTHYADLKQLADEHEAIVNGAMLFDTTQMRPLYKLRVGLPGSSFAFEIAKNVGFPQALLDRASEHVGGAILNFEQQLQQLEADKAALEQKRTEVQLADSFLAEVIAKYEKLNSRLETKKHEIISQARTEARQILADANRTVERTISDIRESQAEKQKTQQARQRLQEESERLASQQERHDDELSRAVQMQTLPAAPEPEVEQLDASLPIKVGTIVGIDGQQTFGQVMEIRGKKAVVESNSMRMTIALDRLTATAKKHLPRDKSSRSEGRFQSVFDDINEKRKSFSPKLDIRGQRVDEAIDNLQHFFDDARLLSEHELRILHGKGYGILKQAVRQWLHSQPDVTDVRSEHLELGGEGITVVQLK